MRRHAPFIAFAVALTALIIVLFAPWAYPQTPVPCQRVDLPVVINLDDIKHVHLIDHANPRPQAQPTPHGGRGVGRHTRPHL